MQMSDAVKFLLKLFCFFVSVKAPEAEVEVMVVSGEAGRRPGDAQLRVGAAASAHNQPRRGGRARRSRAGARTLPPSRPRGAASAARGRHSHHSEL
jgi:hypothetical protein